MPSEKWYRASSQDVALIAKCFGFAAKRVGGYAKWRPGAEHRLHKDYPDILVARVNELCARHLGKSDPEVGRQAGSPGYTDEGIYAFVVSSEVGLVWVKVVIVESDPENPAIEVVSSHKPEHPWSAEVFQQ